MLSNAYFLAKFRFDTAENEPAKNLPNFANFANFANPHPNRGGKQFSSVLLGETGEVASLYARPDVSIDRINQFDNSRKLCFF